MRSLSILLCLYMTVLAILPCRDKDDFGPEITQATLYSVNQTNNHDTQEACPPFCTCSCCSSSRVLKLEEITVCILIQQFKSSYPELAVPALRKQSLNIWQPPQLA
ncbi:DUF6660 family protein [Mucilaginibacter sabulilitoris]|uniref:DUF6660 family protein n=1 Tax=Mucilaginibacter sabulilitoris TaxID=1173583 RepID=UPI003898E0AB